MPTAKHGRLTDAYTLPASFCKGSFSGNANLSRYNLTAGSCVNVNIGEFLFDNGASTNCPTALECGTTYVFRTFAHASSSYYRSDWSATMECSTMACYSEGGCTYTQGYWKTHGPVPTGHNEYVWPEAIKTDGMNLGTVHYDATQLLSIFNTPAAGNGLIALAHQLMAAKLNVANGAGTDINVMVGATTYTDINALISATDALIGNRVVPPVGTGTLSNSVSSPYNDALATYNEGSAGPGHCQ